MIIYFRKIRAINFLWKIHGKVIWWNEFKFRKNKVDSFGILSNQVPIGTLHKFYEPSQKQPDMNKVGNTVKKFFVNQYFWQKFFYKCSSVRMTSLIHPRNIDNWKWKN